MSWFTELLDELYDVKKMFCEDCRKKFKTKKRGLIGDDWNTRESHCIYCGSENIRTNREL